MDFYFSSNSRYFKKPTVSNAVHLVKQLMRKYNITADRILKHYNVTHKVCPAPFVYDINDWENFKNKLADDDTKGNEEMAERIKINVNGKEYAVNGILKDGKNFICLADMKQVGFDCKVCLKSVMKINIFEQLFYRFICVYLKNIISIPKTYKITTKIEFLSFA